MSDNERPSENKPDRQPENHELADQQTESSDSDQHIQPKRSAMDKITKGSTWLIAAIIIVAILTWAIYTYQRTSSKAASKQASQQQFAQVSSRVNKLEQNNERLQEQMARLQQTSSQQSQDIQFTKSTSSRLENQLGGKQMGWLLDEALYLTRLANYNLEYQHDINTSKILLEDADQALFLTGYPEVTDIRRTLAQNITMLEAIPPLDVTGVFLRLQALNTEVNKLPLIAENPAAEKLAKSQKAQNKTDTWKDSLHKNMRSLGKLIVIQRRDKPIQPLISAEQQTLLNLYVSNLFGNAEWALLHRSNKIYQTSLAQIKRIVGTYYATTSDSTQQLLASVDKLATINTAPKLPNIRGTVKALMSLSDRINTDVANASNKKVGATQE